MYRSFHTPLFACRNKAFSTRLLDHALDNAARQFAYPQWGANLNVFMDASMDAET